MMDEITKKLTSNKPIHIQFRTLEARDILSGRVNFKTIYSTGMFNEICIKEGTLLYENIKVTFKGHTDILYFHVRDKLHLDRVKELIRNKYDSLASYGLCIKPIYSKPSGHTNESGKSDNIIYTFELIDIIEGRASLPYYLYINAPDGTRLPDAVPILARRINVHVYKDVYMQFRPNNISIPEIYEVCHKKYSEYEPQMLDLYWGIKSEEAIQKISGIYERKVNGFEFKLIDLLSYRAFLPVYIQDGFFYIKDDIIIIASEIPRNISKGTKVDKLWKRWKPIGPDIPCNSECSIGSICVLDYDQLMDNKVQLPSVKGLVVSMDIVIKFSESSFLCYKQNTLVQDVLWKLHRIYRSNNPLDNNYKIIDPNTHQKVKVDKVYHSFYELLDDFDRDIITSNCVIILDPCCLSVPIPSGTTKKYAESVYIERQKELITRKKEESTRYKMWLKK